MPPVRDDEDLHVLEEPRTRPEALALVALDLVERLAKLDAAALEFDMHERQAVHQDRHVVSVVVGAGAGGVLVQDLQGIPVDVVAVEQHDVADRAVVQGEVDDRCLLDAARLLHDAVGLGGDMGAEEPPPVRVGEGEAVQPLDAPAQVLDERGLVGDVGVLVALLDQLRDQLVLELGLGLVGGRVVRRRGCLGADRGLGSLEQHRVGRRRYAADGIHYRHEAATSLRGKSRRRSR